MEKLSVAFRSRTTWTVVLMFVLAGFEGVRAFIPVELQTYVFGALGMLATYFRVNVKAK